MVDLAADTVARLVDNDVVPTQRRDTSAFEAARPAADQEHLFLLRGGLQRALAVLALMPGGRVHGALELEAARDAQEAALVPVRAGPDVVGTALERLVRKVGLGDQLADHHDCVGIALGDDAIRQHRVVDAADLEHRELLDVCLDGARKLSLVARLKPGVLGRDHDGHRAQQGDADVDVVDEAGLLDLLRRLGVVLDVQAALEHVAADHADADDELGPHSVADLLQHLHAETHAVLERAAVLIRPVVLEGRQELVDQIAVGEMDLDAVETGLLGPLGGVRELVLDGVDLMGLELLRDVVRLVRDRDLRGRYGRAVHLVAVGILVDARVHHLNEQLRAVLLHPVRDVLEAWDDVVRPQAALAEVKVVGVLINRRGADDDHRDAALRALLVVRGGVVVGLVVRPVVRDVRPEDDPVLERHRADLERCEEVLEVAHLASFRWGGRELWPGWEPGPDGAVGALRPCLTGRPRL